MPLRPWMYWYAKPAVEPENLSIIPYIYVSTP